ncbi:MAG: hypothetical protein PHC97_03250 [Patescibacteria group bacterium]|nr:hypothetical protein [Patescibacteria group bacterium]
MFSPEGLPSKKEQAMSPEVLAKWEILKNGREYNAVVKGREYGVPDSVVNEFIKQKIDEHLKAKDYFWLFNFMKATGSGTEEEIKKIGDLAFKKALADKNYATAMELAGKLYGKDSEQYKLSVKSLAKVKIESAKETERIENELEGEEVEISPDATVADLFKAINKLEDKIGEGNSGFGAELSENFDRVVGEELRGEESRKIKVIDFFKRYGYDKDDIEVFLPIRFKKAKKKK